MHDMHIVPTFNILKIYVFECAIFISFTRDSFKKHIHDGHVKDCYEKAHQKSKYIYWPRKGYLLFIKGVADNENKHDTKNN